MQLIRDLETTRDETPRYFSLGERELARTYAPGKWSVRYILLHLKVTSHNAHHLQQIKKALST